jgi:hypothetical protein
VGIGAGGPHIADESWELDHGCDSVLWCGLPLLRGVDPEVWTSRRCGPPGGVDLVSYSAYLDCCFRAAACIDFYNQIWFYPCILDSTTAFALCWEADMTYPLIG